jgi:hypothetical protein
MRQYQFEIASAQPFDDENRSRPARVIIQSANILSLLQTCPVAVKFSVSNTAYPSVPSVFADSGSTK